MYGGGKGRKGIDRSAGGCYCTEKGMRWNGKGDEFQQLHPSTSQQCPEAPQRHPSISPVLPPVHSHSTAQVCLRALLRSSQAMLPMAGVLSLSQYTHSTLQPAQEGTGGIRRDRGQIPPYISYPIFHNCIPCEFPLHSIDTP